MKVAISLGSGSCNHVHIDDAATGQRLYVLTRGELGVIDGEKDPLLLRIRDFVRRYRRDNPAATMAQIRTAVQAEEF